MVYRSSSSRILILWCNCVSFCSGNLEHFKTRFECHKEYLLQEIFRYAVYKLLDKTSAGLEELAGDSLVIHNKPVLAYVAGLGFGLISGVCFKTTRVIKCKNFFLSFQLFQSVNILADTIGPGTMGLKSGSDTFFITSATLALCIILLHTFWSVIFFDGIQTRNNLHILYVVISHLLFSCFTLLNTRELYGLTITLSILNVIIMGLYAFKVVGGSFIKFKRFVTCQQ